jgi:type VI secretion system protein ImpF
LQQVQVTFELNEQSTNALYFAIQALLVVHPAEEPVNFDAMLQPSTLQYSVARTRGQNAVNQAAERAGPPVADGSGRKD